MELFLGKVQKPSNSEYYIPLSEHLRIYLAITFLQIVLKFDIENLHQFKFNYSYF
jgi:hypothetical protein